MAATYERDSGKVGVLLDKTVDVDGDRGDGGDGEGVGEEKEERAKWANKREYLLSTLGYCVGVGNIFRFPYVCNKNGGGAFLLPFLLCLLLIGMPMFFLESAMGQFRGKSPLHVWSICPLLKGIGITTGLLSATVYWYFSVILAWALYYLASSCQATLPWTRCDGWWNTPLCTSFIGAPNSSRPQTNGNVTSLGEMTSLNGSGVSGYSNQSFLAMTSLNASGDGGSNGTAVNQSTDVITNTVGPVKLVTAAEEFWQHNVLQKSSGLYETGEVVWYLAVCQVVVILCTFLALVKGIKTSGKVVYVTATAPYVLLTVLLIRSATLPGAGEGVLFYITPDFQRLVDYNIWIQAALQVFYSLAIAWGVCQTLASFNHFHNNLLRDCVIITLIGEGTSVFAGFAVFSILGYLANQSSVPIDQVVSSGPGLAFVVYPEALSLMPLSQLWAVLFFLMLVTVVIDTQLATGETMFTVLSDQFPRTLLRHGLLVRVVVTLVVLLSSMLLVTQGGVYVFQLVDWYVGSYTTTVVALLECVVVAWVYGVDRFGEDVEMMIGRKPPKIMNILWRFVFPACFTILLVFTLAEYEKPTYGDYQYDTFATVIGWMIATVSFLPIPVVAVIQLLRAKGSLLQRLKDASKPDKEWGPSDKSLHCTPIHNSTYPSHV